MIGSDVGQLQNVEPTKKMLEKVQETLRAEDIPCEIKTIFGGTAAGESIVDYAKEIAADEIIIGVRRKSKVGKLIFGSTAQHVILEAHCPVLTVK
jgi:nucleotide-binding universal stress UspA family protein